MSKFAVFDIDGTLYRWQLYHELFDEFASRGVIDNSEAQSVLSARRKWQERNKSFTDYETSLMSVMERIIIGLPLQTLQDAAKQIIEQNSSHIYRYTTELMQQLKSQGYTILAISGSHQVLVDSFAKRHGIDITYGRQFITQDGIIAASKGMVYGKKKEILQNLVREHELDWNDSYGVGDTASDIDMLALVEHPVAFNPTSELLERAKNEGWSIVIERKSIAYRLERQKNEFILAETIAY